MAPPLSARRRILVAVEPRVLGDALAAVLTDVGLDDVVLSGAGAADDPASPIDVAVLSRPHPAVEADLIIEVDTGVDRGSIVTSLDTVEVVLTTPHDLLVILDEYCPAPSLRVMAPAADGVRQ